MELRFYIQRHTHIQYIQLSELRVLTCTYGRKSKKVKDVHYMNKNRESDPYGSVANMQVKASLLVVKLQVYGKVIFILKLLYHSIIKIHQKTRKEEGTSS